MEKVQTGTADLAEENVRRLAELFPQVATEVTGEDGQLQRAIDFDALRGLLGDVAEGGRERYQLTWPGKQEARAEAFTPVGKTLRPCLEKSVDWETTGNLYIEGDNLDALKILHETYAGKVKLIYIDPPYNTGKDFIYHDDYRQSREEYEAASGEFDEEGGRLVANMQGNGRFHSDWCSMMYPRLLLARDLLRGDGVLAASIDEHERNNLKSILDEVFGASNFCGEIIWKNSSKNDEDYIAMQHEYILVYVRSKAENPGAWVERKGGLEEIYAAFEGFHREFGDDWKAIHKAALAWYKRFPESSPIYASKHYSWMDERGVYFPADISGPNDGQYIYDVVHPVTGKVCKRPSTGWRYPKAEMERRIADNLVHFGDDETTVPNNKTYLANTEYQSLTSILYRDGRVASKNLQALFGVKVFSNPKDADVLSRLMRAFGVGENDIVCDFFSGSATTAEAVMRFNRENGTSVRWLLVQVAEDLRETAKKAQGSSKKITSNAIAYLEKKGRPALLTELAEERLILAGAKIASELEAENAQLKLGEDPKPLPDLGFRVLRVDSSNFRDVSATPEETSQTALFDAVDNVKAERSELDLLFEVLPAFRIPYSASIEERQVAGKRCFVVDGGYLIACFDVGVTTETIEQIAKLRPVYAVMRDASMADDATQANFEELFRTHSPDTVRRVI